MRRGGTHEVLRGATFGISEGEKVGLVGPNGCGKSTLLAIVAGRETADRGRVVPTRPGLVIAHLPQSPEASLVNAAIREALIDPSEDPPPMEWEACRMLAGLGLAHLNEEGAPGAVGNRFLQTGGNCCRSRASKEVQ